jgi:hypothetical protein
MLSKLKLYEQIINFTGVYPFVFAGRVRQYIIRIKNLPLKQLTSYENLKVGIKEKPAITPTLAK